VPLAVEGDFVELSTLLSELVGSFRARYCRILPMPADLPASVVGPRCRRLGCVEFTRCPYDASPIEVEASASGSTLLSCSTCGAAWEWYKTWLRRIREPDREAVRSARAANAPVQVIRGAPNPALSAAMWRQVKSSSGSISHRSNPTPPTS
jgi:hypothetical protein